MVEVADTQLKISISSCYLDDCSLLVVCGITRPGTISIRDIVKHRLRLLSLSRESGVFT